VQMPIEERVRHIIEDYQPWEYKQELLQAFRQIQSRIHTPIAKEIDMHLVAERYEDAVRLLLEHYYDPRYEHAMNQYKQERVLIKANNIEEAVQAIKNQLVSAKTVSI
jgi:tRNA 2-selenouridine synthase